MLDALDRNDVEWVVDELRLLPKQSQMYKDVPDNPEWVKGYFYSMLNSNMLYGVVDRIKRSFLLFTATKPWYADRVELHEIILWVPEEYRGGRTAYLLIKRYKDYAIYLDDFKFPIHSIHAGATLDITNNEKTLWLYQQAGFERDGAGVVMRL